MKKTDPHLVVIFGASGDLTKRKLIPALFNLYEKNLLHEKFAVLGASRTSLTDSAFREKMLEFLPDTELSHKFLSHLYYEAIQTSIADDYIKLKNRLNDLSKQKGINNNVVFYLSTPPSLYTVIPKLLSHVGLNNEDDGFKRLIVEKPFGTDLSSAKQLNKDLLQYFNEHQIYRIDHYLGKETVQNLLVLRFSNSFLEPLWNHKYIEHIQITSAEKLGVEKRGGYYDQSGAMRDMLQNHLMQLLGLVAMEPPTEVGADAIRNEMLKVFQSIRPFKDENDIENNVVRGQYTSSTIKGEFMPGYREEEGVQNNSRTETFVAMKLHIDNWRWSGIPFYIRTGKKLPTRATEIVINYRPTPHHLFGNENADQTLNQLIIRIQPDEGVLLKIGLKVPGAGFKVQTVNMDFHYSDLSEVEVPTAYERLLLDCIHGDATLYARGDNVEKAWELVQPVMEAWANNANFPLHGYPAGTWGPLASEELIKEEQTGWRYPCKNLAGDGEYCEL